MPLPTATSIATSEFFSAFSPAAGVWLMTVPGGASVDTFSFVVGLSLSSASVSFFSASNVDFAPVTSGTTTFLGRNRNSKQREQEEQRQEQRHPPRQVRLVAEDDLVGQQRDRRRRGGAAAAP